ncbi:hypothetical protein PRIPAC_77366 [Pristionchus pacificus]|uniref:Uncharacterized protein n=1 Tax=Pristionchus pacificus TaxID=54126 RepID=A0A2A6CK84_PRIPA|nr:hypothetical protein PRIPAC_77366 [Pristionchus pacificus]|eukprot:PDM78487.1 hypothetical protein PRIPAC_31066 [Pristionchus pacificus]
MRVTREAVDEEESGIQRGQYDVWIDLDASSWHPSADYRNAASTPARSAVPGAGRHGRTATSVPSAGHAAVGMPNYSVPPSQAPFHPGPYQGPGFNPAPYIVVGQLPPMSSSVLALTPGARLYSNQQYFDNVREKEKREE